MGKRRGRQRGRSRAKNGREFPATESGIMEWIFDFAFEYEKQSDRYRDRAWDIEFEGELPEGYIEAYKAFRTQALDSLERLLSPEDFERLTDELTEDDIALDVWYSVGGHGVGIWDGRWSFLDADGADIDRDLGKDQNLSGLYYEMDDQAGAGAGRVGSRGASSRGASWTSVPSVLAMKMATWRRFPMRRRLDSWSILLERSTV